jgi:Tfp pilus assembly protein PilE
MGGISKMKKLKINLKSRKGITLISLVITIIILIILASIAIAQLTR